ncbi:MAG: hypothetical protein ACI8P9_000908 [Parasphingorhabdus sp.]|jgi:hypothetical protein
MLTCLTRKKLPLALGGFLIIFSASVTATSQIPTKRLVDISVAYQSSEIADTSSQIAKGWTSTQIFPTKHSRSISGLPNQIDHQFNLENLESPSSGLSKSRQIIIAEQLLAATRDIDNSLKLGPITACFERMRLFACPIVSAIPMVNYFAGELALELGISCPIAPGV